MGQGFAHERLPEKGTVLLLDTYDLTEILKECQSYASVGYKIALCTGRCTGKSRT